MEKEEAENMELLQAEIDVTQRMEMVTSFVAITNASESVATFFLEVSIL